MRGVFVFIQGLSHQRKLPAQGLNLGGIDPICAEHIDRAINRGRSLASYATTCLARSCGGLRQDGSNISTPAPVAAPGTFARLLTPIAIST